MSVASPGTAPILPKRRRPAAALGLALTISPSAVLAAAPPDTGPFFVQIVVGLLLVLALMYGFFWLMRRIAPGQATVHGVVKVVGGVMLSPRERLVVVEVADTWLLIGVAAGNVSLLHRLDKPATADSPDLSPAGGPFAERLAEWLRRSTKAG